MTYHILILLFITATALCQLPASNWQIQSPNSTVWQGYGLVKQIGTCSWNFREGGHNIVVKLFEDVSYNRYLTIILFLNYSINKAYPYYNGTAHAQYQLFTKDQYHEQVKDFSIMPQVYLFNGTLTVSEGNDTLTVKMFKQQVSFWLTDIALVHLVVKIGLLFLMVQAFREANNKLSMAFVYVLIGWELQAHLQVIKIFEEDENLAEFGIIIGMAGWVGTLSSLLVLPRPLVPWESFEGLIYYAYACTSGVIFSQAGNVMLYALSPLLQIRFNILRNTKNAICPYGLGMYLINIFFIYYFKACPACVLRYPLDMSLCIKATIVATILSVLVVMQGRYGPLLCLRQYFRGKDHNYMVEIEFSEGEELMEEVCAICLQPLATEALVQNYREQGGARKGSIMRTPCNHKYHGACLRVWLNEKSTCPMDNLPIPPCFQ